jgi:hypothetical protein
MSRFVFGSDARLSQHDQDASRFNNMAGHFGAAAERAAPHPLAYSRRLLLA